MTRLRTWTPDELLRLAEETAQQVMHGPDCTCLRCNTARRQREAIHHIADRRTEET